MDRSALIEHHVRLQTEFAKSLTVQDISPSVLRRAQWVLLDSLGCILSCYFKYRKKQLCMTNGTQKGGPGEEEKVFEYTAAMMNTELYEGNRLASGHPACHILPLMLAGCAPETSDLPCEEKELSYGQFLMDFIISYELAGRWNSAVRLRKGALGHGTVMGTGAATAEVLMSHGTGEDLYHTILLTASLPVVSVWQSVYDGSELHDIYPAIAALHAKRMYQLRKKWNYFSTGAVVDQVYSEMLSAKIIPEILSENLGSKYWIESNYFKVHTGCRFIHMFADVIKGWIKEGLKKEDISSINIYTYKKAAALKNRQVSNALAAKFSIPVALAVLIIKGTLSPDALEGCENDAEVLHMSAKICVAEEEAYNRILPDVRGGRVILRKKNGQIMGQEIFHAFGDFDNPVPFTENDLKAKFFEQTKDVLDCTARKELEDRILSPDFMKEPVQKILEIFYKSEMQGGIGNG